MRVGVWMPNTMPFGLERSFFLDWVRLADRAGFDTLSTLDRPNYDMWDPLVSLAAARCGDRAQPSSHHAAPAKPQRGAGRQASRGDRYRLSGGRLSLGVSLGSRPDDYQVFGATLEYRVTRFRRQVARIRQIWAEARQSDREHGVLGPPPVRTPDRRSGSARSASGLGSELSSSPTAEFIFRGRRPTIDVGPAIESMRPQVAERGDTDFSFNAVAYVAIGGQREFSEAVAHHEALLPGPAGAGGAGDPPRSHRQDQGRRRRLRGVRSRPAGADARSPRPAAAGAAFRARPARVPALTRIWPAGKSTGANHLYAPCWAELLRSAGGLPTRSMANGDQAMATAGRVRRLARTRGS